MEFRPCTRPALCTSGCPGVRPGCVQSTCVPGCDGGHRGAGRGLHALVQARLCTWLLEKKCLKMELSAPS